jgi:hypothetical protein
MEGLLVERVDRHPGQAKKTRIVKDSDLQDHQRQVRPPGRRKSRRIRA